MAVAMQRVDDNKGMRLNWRIPLCFAYGGIKRSISFNNRYIQRKKQPSSTFIRSRLPFSQRDLR